MKNKKEPRRIKKITLLWLLPLGFFFIIGVGWYFNHQVIDSAVEGCEKKGGEVNLEKDILAINWSFSCER
ncbi:hypothetical protein [Guptibacillus sedimenti]|uniref:hypothetical protein n=1 Tax=Guptibacillus sedimenti TaxID=3025680 RepID=UPI0023626BFA|nr:hypothetical protein [Pseudalkalibacillus sedimenti]